MKVVINKCYGGFGLSYKGVMHYAKLKGIKLYAYTDEASTPDGRYIPPDKRKLKEYDGSRDQLFVYYATKPCKNCKQLNENYYHPYDMKRDDPDLIKTVEQLGKKANGSFAELSIVEIPDGTHYLIDDYDGIEHIAEEHMTWY